MNTYERNRVCHFSKAKEQWGELGNMTGGFAFSVNEVRVNSSETLYQAMRFTAHPEIQREILAQSGGMGAKMVSKKYRKEFTRPDWDEIKELVMLWCLQLKFANNSHRLGHLLTLTGQRPIVEESKKDDYWGAKPVGDTLVGENMLGQLWMIVRDSYCFDIMNNLSDYKIVANPDIEDFMLLGREIQHHHFY